MGTVIKEDRALGTAAPLVGILRACVGGDVFLWLWLGSRSLEEAGQPGLERGGSDISLLAVVAWSFQTSAGYHYTRTWSQTSEMS